MHLDIDDIVTTIFPSFKLVLSLSLYTRRSLFVHSLTLSLTDFYLAFPPFFSLGKDYFAVVLTPIYTVLLHELILLQDFPFQYQLETFGEYLSELNNAER